MISLNVSRHEAEQRLREQIQRADDLLSMSSLTDCTEQVSKWYSYTLLLLKKLFSNEEYSSEFHSARVQVVINRRQDSADLLKRLKGTLGKRKRKLESFIERLPLLDEPSIQAVFEKKSAVTLDNKSVFIVHGHHGEAKQEVARFLERLGLNAVILHEQASASKTIIEKIEAHTNVGYGVVLYTDCDVGSTKSVPEKLKPRARQNVVFEHGFLMGKLGRGKVAALVKGNIEIPNDISGVVYIGMNDESWKNALVKELMAADIEVDVAMLL